ncbi:nitrate and chloride transporter [Trifolium pratense]|uniref:Nitrate and chloride transporter n=1 Tax=Trifolium pratense TaxID=57577 RepID=A0A2K3KZ50_TRIPR|nr:nitrate and chloride transporter [Trifolium pratense]
MVEGVGSSMGLSEKKNLIIQVITGRWFVVFASFLIMSASGATYMFGIYSGTIKTALGYDQTTLNLLSFFKDLGGNLGIFSGLINEITPPYVVLAMGSVLNFFGANSQSFSNTGSLVTCVKNFPETRGVVLGILKATLIGAFISLILVARTIQFYKGDIYKRYRSEPVEVEGDTAEMKVVQSGGERGQDEAKAAEK